MKIRTKILMVISVLIISSISVTSFFIYEFLESSLIENEIYDMMNTIDSKSIEIQTLHNKASEDLVFALKNPLFVEYFELPESKAGNVYKDGTLQFTDQQQEIKSKLENWIFNFQNKFQVDETCLIDVSGQEHTRLVLKKTAPDYDLSSEEKLAPFFEPSFEKSLDEVHLQFPYVSPDTNRWVFAYASPVVLGDTQKPAIYHFEMPIDIFEDIVDVNIGRMFVLDPEGFVIADSDRTFDNNNVDLEFEEYFHTIDSISDTQEFSELFQKMTQESEGNGTYTDDNDIHYVTYSTLSTFGWILAYEQPKSLILSESSQSFGDLFSTIMGISITVMSITIIVTFFVSSRITRPIVELKNTIKNTKSGLLQKSLDLKGDDEIVELSNSINEMNENLKQERKDALRNEKLSAIGHLAANMAHDMRNPLYAIKNSAHIIKSRVSDDIGKRELERMNRSIARINHQIVQVLDFVRQSPIQLESYSLNHVLKGVINSLEVSENITITIPTKDYEVLIDRHKMESAIYNILFNAIQAISSNKGNISITANDTNNHITIEITNDGPLIPDTTFPHIYEPLFTTKQKGTGLGLSSAKNTVEQHKGTITAKNDPVSFTITLPKDSNNSKNEEI
jgi:signal transduction histidine kinase